MEPDESPGVQMNGATVSTQYYKLYKIILATALFYFPEHMEIKLKKILSVFHRAQWQRIYI